MLLKLTRSAILTIYVINLLSVSSCKKKENIDDGNTTSLRILSFKFEKKNNPQLSNDIVFEIKNNTVTGTLNKLFFTGVPTFTTNAQSIEINGKSQLSEQSRVDFRQEVVYSLKSSTGEVQNIPVKIIWDDVLPSFNITTNGGASINSVETYVAGKLAINGRKTFADFSGTIQIRGRGNTTWTYPKKPYKIKLDEKASVLGLSPAKDWVLLANYIDGMHVLNAVAMKTGKLMNMAYTNNIIPVEVTLNGQYQGLYMLTEQVEVQSNRVNIGDSGQFLLLDSNFNDEWKFQSAAFKLPVMVKHPELKSEAEMMPIKNQFEQFEALVASPNFPNNNYLDYFDAEAFANYMLVQILTDNEEINHPKSTYIYKTKTGKYTIGPIWDFDWAFAYESSPKHLLSYDRPIFWSPPSVGTRFFSRFFTDSRIKSLLKTKWADFKTNKIAELYTYIDEYAYSIEGARGRDYARWKQGNVDFKNDIRSLKTWLQNRTNYTTTFIQNL